jgi:protein-L-isoaspartate(D-aspartate) O-methyltransferase
MSDTHIEVARLNMIEQQIRPWEVLDPRVLDAFGQIPREMFVAEKYRQLAFADVEIPIGHGQCMMKPVLEGRLLQALSLEPGDSVLEIGTGSGFLTACLARLGAKVTSVELYEDLKFAAVQRLRDLEIENVRLRVGDAADGWEPERSFDAIAVTGSMPGIPRHFREQLRLGGRLFAVTGQSPAMRAWLVTRVGDAQWSEECLFETDLRRLENVSEEAEFVF